MARNEVAMATSLESRKPCDKILSLQFVMNVILVSRSKCRGGLLRVRKFVCC